MYAQVVVEAEIFPKILPCLMDLDGNVRKYAATAIREVAKHTPELAQLIVSNGTLDPLHIRHTMYLSSAAPHPSELHPYLLRI